MEVAENKTERGEQRVTSSGRERLHSRLDAGNTSETHGLLPDLNNIKEKTEEVREISLYALNCFHKVCQLFTLFHSTNKLLKCEMLICLVDRPQYHLPNYRLEA